jgi:hypothetical protein
MKTTSISIQVEVFNKRRFANLVERCVNVSVSIQRSALNFQFGEIYTCFDLFEYVEQILDVTAIHLESLISFIRAEISRLLGN